MKPTGDFEWVREFGKLFFTFALGIDGLNDSGGWVLGRGAFNSTDCQATLSLASQIQFSRFAYSFQGFVCKDVVET